MFTGILSVIYEKSKWIIKSLYNSEKIYLNIKLINYKNTICSYSGLALTTFQTQNY